MKPAHLEALRALVAASDSNIASGGDGWVTSKEVFPSTMTRAATNRLWPLFGLERALERKYYWNRSGQPLAWRPNDLGRKVLTSSDGRLSAKEGML